MAVAPLAGCTFEISCENDPDELFSYAEVLQKLGGQILNDSVSSGGTLFELVDARDTGNCSARQLSPTWLRFQCHYPAWLSPELSPLFRPLPTAQGIAEMRSLVICASGLPPDDFAHARLLVAAAGASFSKHLQPGYTTHLICSHAVDGNQQRTRAKVRGAMRWREAGGEIHVVRLSWLVECVQHWRRLDEAYHTVEGRKPRSRFRPLSFVQPTSNTSRPDGNGGRHVPTVAGVVWGVREVGRGRCTTIRASENSSQSDFGAHIRTHIGTLAAEKDAELGILVHAASQPKMSTLLDVKEGGAAFNIVMLASHVVGDYLLHAPPGMRAILPPEGSLVVLRVQSERWQLRYLSPGIFSTGWRGFAVDQRLCVDDSVVCQLKPLIREQVVVDGLHGLELTLHVFRKSMCGSAERAERQAAALVRAIERSTSCAEQGHDSDDAVGERQSIPNPSPPTHRALHVHSIRCHTLRQVSSRRASASVASRASAHRDSLC